MARDPLATFTFGSTPQTQPIPGRAGQVRNNAGGYGFAKNLMTKVEDFLILGTTGGTYYVGEDKLTTDNIGWLVDAIRADGPAVVALIEDVSASKPPRAPKNRACVFALAMVFAKGDPAAVQAAKAAFPAVVRTTDHLSMFFGYSKQLRGKVGNGNGTSLRTGRALRSALGSWFLADDVESVAWKTCKARQRATPAGEAFALQDALRIAHPSAARQEQKELLTWLTNNTDAEVHAQGEAIEAIRANTAKRRALLGWLVGTVGDSEVRAQVEAVDAFLTAQAAISPAQAIRVVIERTVPWEYLPPEVLKVPAVWEALAPHVGMTALIRNLARMTRLGVLGPYAAANSVVTRRLTDAQALNRARIHPMDVFLALRVYNSGTSQPNPRAERQTWNPVGDISDALEEAFDLSFGAVAPSGKRLLVAVDSSGSMSGGWYGGQVTMGGSPLGSPYEIGCAMAVILKRIEGDNVHIIDVDTAVHTSRVTKRTNLREIRSWQPSGGGTDLSLPFGHATRNRLPVDGFIVLTDNETWAGRQHPVQALAHYRDFCNQPAARVVVASMTATGHSIADPGDEGVLNMAGMDASLPKVALQFIR